MIRTNIIFKMECLEMTNVCSVQCDQIGRFLKVLGNRLSCKISPNDWKVFGLFWKTSLLLKTALPTFLGNFWKNFATFFSKIWSHCSILPKAEKPRNNKVWAIYYCNSLLNIFDWSICCVQTYIEFYDLKSHQAEWEQLEVNKWALMQLVLCS